jgi:hypothetical protein
MKRFVTVLFIMALLPILLTSNVNAEAPYEFSLDLQTYRPTKVFFNFPFTNNHSLSDISTVGPSNYDYDLSAQGTGGMTLTFIAEDIDVYTFTLYLYYGNMTISNASRTVLISVGSGNEPLDGAAIIGSGDFVIHIRLSLSEQPSYPTEQDVAREVVHQMEQKIVGMEEENRKLKEEIEAAATSSSAVNFVTMVGVWIAIILGGFGAIRRRRSVKNV